MAADGGEGVKAAETTAYRDAPAGMGYRTQAADTTREIEELQLKAWREMEPWQKLQQVEELCRVTDHLAIQGILMRHPDASEEEVGKRLTALRYGRELSVALNDWDPLVHGW